ncbi:MAG: transposase [Verrucomicrobia bacterium]|nr:transposase [Verrucomicrobiota bacterium]
MRTPRFKLPRETSAVYHCISRIVAGEFLLAPDTTKERLRTMMRRQAAFCGVQIITYSLMSNHFHILTRVPAQPDLTDQDLLKRVETFYGKSAAESRFIAESLRITGSIPELDRVRLLKRMHDVSVFMKELKQRFSVWYNKQHNRFGTLWAERFRSILVEDRPEVVRTVAAYIDLNPVRAGMVADPADYRFCGYTDAASGNLLAINGIESFEGPEGGDWRKVVGKYQITLFGKTRFAGAGADPDLEIEKIRALWKGKGRLSHLQSLRLRIRYFNDGAVLGSRLFVEEMFRKHRDRFGPKRTSGARPLRRLPFKGLRTLRALRKSIVA